jgi:hypothetical protein
MEQVYAIKPLMDISKDKKCILLTPLPHYIASGCCLNPEHCSNRYRFPDFKQHMLDSLAMLRKNCIHEYETDLSAGSVYGSDWP